MNSTVALINRNMKLFLRDKMAVFFSFLSTLILIVLYFLFIAKIYTSGMDNPANGGISMPLALDTKNFIVYLQMMAGVLALNSMSLATGAFSTIAKDFEDKRIDNMLLTPVKTREMIVAYFTTGLIASFVINTFTWILSYMIIGFSTSYWLSIESFVSVWAALFVASLISCSIMLLITTLVKSSTAIGIINGIAGTFFGFLCGIYMPYSNLGESTKAVGSFLPFTHITIWLKQIMLGDAFTQIGIPSEAKSILLSDYFSADGVGLCGFDVPLWEMVIYSAIIGLACLIVSYVLLNGKIKGQKVQTAPM